jgi:uncharacterized surface protein with fasciclin (FAS1) repeats
METTNKNFKGKRPGSKVSFKKVSLLWLVFILAIGLAACTGSPKALKQKNDGPPPVYDTAKLPEILQPLMVNNKLTTSDMVAMKSVVTRQGTAIEVTSKNGKLILNGNVNVVGETIIACNGIIYVIDRMITLPDENADETAQPEGMTATPAATPVSCQDGQTIADLLRADPRFSDFVLALESMGYMDMLDQDGYYTIFAPPNGVFIAPTIDANGEKITICHHTGSEKNPYVEITIDINGLHGHENHSGDIIPAPAGGCPEKTK